MKLISVVSNYQLLLAILYKIEYLYDEKVVIMISNHLANKYKNYEELKYFFEDIIVFNISAKYNNKLENMIGYFDQLFVHHHRNINDFDEIYCAAAHHSFGIYLVQKKKNFLFIEDGAGMISKYKDLLNIEIKINKNKAYAIEQLGLFSGTSKYIKSVIIDNKKQLQNFKTEKYVIHFSVEDALQKISSENMKKIKDMIGIKNDIKIPVDSCIIFTEHFANLKILTYEYQCKVYQLLVDYFLCQKNIVFKPHPDDIAYYGILFPEAVVIREKFPAELFPYIVSEKPKYIVGLSTTSVNNLDYLKCEKISFDVNIRNKYIIDSFHKYYIATLILNKINKKYNIYIKNIYNLLLDNMNKYAHNLSDGYNYVDNIEAADIIIMDHLLDINMQANISNAKYVIFLDNPYKIYGQDVLNDHLSIIKINKNTYRKDFVYDNLEDEYLYVYTNNNLEDINIMEEKKLENSGIDLKAETLTDDKLKIAILEGILKATEERLITELERQNKESNDENN